MEDIRPLEEAQTSILQSAENGSLNLESEKDIKEVITVQKAQILRSAKMISALRDKLTQSQSANEDLQLKISSQETEIAKLQEDLLINKLTMEKTSQKLKSTELERMSLFEDKAKLQTDLENRDKFIRERDIQFSNIIKLVTEIDLCVNDMRKLVELGESIAKGEEPPVSSLLGLSDELEMHLQSLQEENDTGQELQSTDIEANNSFSIHNHSNANNSLVGKYLASINNGSSMSYSEEFSLKDMEWVLDRIKKIRDLRQNIALIRDQVNDVYTDMLGGKVEGCGIQ